MAYVLETDVFVKETKLVDVSVEEYISIKIKRLRKSKNYSQGDLANKLKINRSSISNIEKGKQNLTLQNLEAICKIFECKSSDILPF